MGACPSRGRRRAAAHRPGGIRDWTHNGAGPQQSFNPAWSPDGTRIAFTELVPGTGNDFTGDIWTMTVNGQDQKEVSRSSLFEFRPDWGVAP